MSTNNKKTEEEPVLATEPEKTKEEKAREAFEALASRYGETVGEVTLDERSGIFNAEFFDATGQHTRTIARSADAE